MASEQLVVFQLGSEEYAVSIAQVKEIIRYGGATKLPNTPPHMEGIINLRGKVIPVIDLGKRFGLERARRGEVQALIVEAAGREVGMVVDEVSEVLRLEDNAIESAQAVTRVGDFLRGIGKTGDRLLIILNLDRLFSEEEHVEMQAAG
ncbi:chemotaxis protein CheW [Anaeroselena agilis]|uniref:Chemotaxis protein CheW n=1 Tax=Anaeroselena agilis TaxID=3063788 RepID=A0ABU3P3G4_9FIRM|nr:chemotaxis protein CheW [Selenomonadales bacterium 4137-cl]